MQLFQARLRGDYEEDADIVRAGYARLRKLLSDLTASLGKRERIGKDYIYSLLCKCKDGVATFGLMFLTNQQDNDLALLEGFFSRKLGKEIEGRRTTGERDKIIRFYSSLHLGRFQWENTTEFYAWLKAEKGRKEVQGKGVFNKVGVKPEKVTKPEVELIVCPTHGVLEEVRWTKLIAPPRAWRHDAGQEYAVLVGGGERLCLHLDDEFKGRREQYD